MVVDSSISVTSFVERNVTYILFAAESYPGVPVSLLNRRTFATSSLIHVDDTDCFAERVVQARNVLQTCNAR
jgi:hypothetical protein